MQRFFLVAIVLAGCACPVHAQVLEVVGVEPPMNGNNVAVGSPIKVHFNDGLVAVSPSSFWAFGRWSGAVEGKITYEDVDTVVLTPDEPLAYGEQVMVIVAAGLIDSQGDPLLHGFSWQFMTRARPSPMSYSLIASLSTKAFPNEPVRSYGGIASDLDNDGWLDLTIVNEDSADLRVFKNAGNPAAPYSSFLQPTFDVGQRASPSEPADFNRDGFTDICVANIDANTVSVLLGNGDGTFAPQQLINVGLAPRGIAVADCDGDGDMDIINTNATSSNMSRMFNNGKGVFGPPTFWEGGGAGEWGLVAADMDEDGILDMVIGARTGQQMVINKGNGAGGYGFLSATPAGGSVWMVNAGDVNGDGHADVATANSTNNTGSILLGNGAGGLSPPTTTPTDSFPLGSDLGDLDGDGDLDWGLSSFNGDWRIYKNNGNGGFAFNQEFNSPIAASCILMFDCENDGDLDLGMIDEIADVVVLMRSNGIGNPGDANADGAIDVDDLLLVINTWGTCTPGQPCPADLNGDDVVDVDDLLLVINNWD